MSDRTTADDQRDTGFAAREEHRRRSYELEDRRWTLRMQVRDWIVLAGLMAISIGWMFVAYLFEPGLR